LLDLTSAILCMRLQGVLTSWKSERLLKTCADDGSCHMMVVWRARLGDISHFEPTKSGANKQYARNPRNIQSRRGLASLGACGPAVSGVRFLSKPAIQAGRYSPTPWVHSLCLVSSCFPRPFGVSGHASPTTDQAGGPRAKSRTRDQPPARTNPL
jgi:hypothetical protein